MKKRKTMKSERDGSSVEGELKLPFFVPLPRTEERKVMADTFLEKDIPIDMMSTGIQKP